MHPLPVGLLSDAGDLHAARFQVDDKQDQVADDPKGAQYFDGEEVGSGNYLEVGLEECTPWYSSSSFRRRIQPGILENASDGIAPELVAKIGEGAAEACVAP